MGLIDAQREQLMAQRANLRGGRKMFIFMLIVNGSAAVFAAFNHSIVWLIINVPFVLWWAWGIDSSTRKIDEINDKLENEE